MLKFISICSLNLLVANLSLFWGNPLLPETLQNNEKPKICFTENKGQVHDQNYKARPDVLYGAMAGNMAVHIKNNGVSYQLYRVDKYKEVEDPITKEKRQEIDQQSIYRVDLTWVNANKNFAKNEDEALPGYNNYYLESCPNGALNVKSYKGITLNNLYPGINLHYYEKNGELKHDYIVAPHADYKQIQVKVEGSEVSVNKDGSLLLTTPLGKIQEGAPLVYQNGKQLKASWLVKNNILSFEIENHNSNYELIIDPVTRLWGTYYGGPGGEEIHFTTTNLSGDVYLGGYTNSWIGITIATIGSHQSNFAGNGDAFLAKLNSAGVRQWGTFYGTTSYEIGFSGCTDASGNVYLAGYAQPSNFNLIATVGSHQPSFGGGTWDSFLVKFNSVGVRQWGTFYGGLNDDSGRSCATDTAGNVYLAGNTTSFNGISTVGSHQPSHAGGSNDAFLVKLNSNGVRQWATYCGGGSADVGYSCSTDGVGNVYLSGYTASNSGTGIATPGCHQSVYGGGNSDAFIVKFDGSGVRQWGTYYGDTAFDIGFTCADTLGNVYMTGYTASGLGTALGTLGSHQPAHGGGFWDGYLVKFNSAGVRQWGTYYGGTGGDLAESCAMDSFGNVYVAGSTGSTTGTVIATPGTYQSTSVGGGAYLVKFNGNGQRQWGTYYGGSVGAAGRSCSTDATGNIYLGGDTYTNAGTEIATIGSHQPSFAGGGADGFLVKFMYCDGVSPAALVNSTVCANSVLNFSVSFTGTINPSFIWSGPASFSSNIQNPSIASASTINVGTYSVIVTSNGCVETITTQVEVVVNPTISVNSGGICPGDSFTIIPAGANTYTVTGGSFVVSPSANTSYSVTGSSTAGCVFTSSAISNVTINTTPTVAVNSGSICPGNSFTIVPSGAGTYTVTGGNFIVSPGSNTSYSVTGTSTAGCVSASPAISNVMINAIPTVAASGGIICAGESFTISPTGAIAYSVTGGNFIVSPTVSTSFSVTGTNTAGCISAAAVFTVIVYECIGISENPGIHPSFLKIYPNPNHGQFNVESDSKAELLLIDLQGRIVGNQTLVAGKNQISIEHLENGVYFLEISHPIGKEVFRIIKQ